MVVPPTRRAVVHPNAEAPAGRDADVWDAHKRRNGRTKAALSLNCARNIETFPPTV